MSVLVETTVGDLVFDLYTEERPRSCLNFLKLCKIKYYNYCLFHSVRRNFIAQCGDPSGTGRGGNSIYSYIYGDQAKYFDLETKPRIKHKTKGTISFVNNGNDKHGSQFFITMGEGLDFLDGKHTIFGTLAEGFETLEKLNETICDDSHKPYQDVRITHTIILYDPYDDPKGLEIPDRSPEPTKEQLESGRIAADEEIDDKGKSKEEVQKALDDKELQIGTKILEVVGDINEADEKPPENVLFVCKLNPVTNAEDLKIIFSRFGKIKSCEIIKDYKTGESLCYGFVEFKEVEACEKAYFKMDNVLIDDRRIHVDFCQSISKVKKWHKSTSYQKNVKELPTGETYELKGNKMKKDKEKYSMVFEEETPVKHKKKEARDIPKEKTKKKHESESEEERPVVKKSLNEKKSKSSITKESRKRRKSTSASESEEEEIKHSKPKKKQDTTRKEKPEARKRDKKEKVPQSDLSSDEHEKYSKKDRKKKNDKTVESKTEELKTTKKSHPKKDKKCKYSDDSDEEEEKEKVYKMKAKKKKVVEYYSDSDVDEPKVAKKAKKEKYSDKKKRKTHESDDEHNGRNSRSDKQKGSVKKSKGNKSKSRHIEDSDTEDYGDGEEEVHSSKKRRSDYSSNESSEEETRKPSKKASQSRRDSSDDDRKKKSSRKKVASKKKGRRRHDSSDSDSDSE